jgi:hypothetical protein
MAKINPAIPILKPKTFKAVNSLLFLIWYKNICSQFFNMIYSFFNDDFDDDYF